MKNKYHVKICDGSKPKEVDMVQFSELIKLPKEHEYDIPGVDYFP